MKTRLTALLTAGILLTSAVSLPPAAAFDRPIEGSVLNEIPDWVPTDFAGAMQFYNEHGKTWVEDNVICLVRPMFQWKVDDCLTTLGGSMTLVNTPAGDLPQIYELDIPQKPDPSDEDAVAEFEAYCDRLGIYTHDYSFFEKYASCRTQYAFQVELYRVLEGEDLTVTWLEKQGDDEQTMEVFRFENPDGTTVETDYYSWVPDCQPEFEEYFQTYGRASVQNNCILYCSDFDPDVMLMEQSGGGMIEEVLRADCKGFHLMTLDGEGTPAVIVYQPAADGQVDVKWSVDQTMSAETIDPTKGVYEIRDNCTILLDHSPDRKAQTIFTFIDKDTGKMLEFPRNAVSIHLVKTPAGEDQVPISYTIRSNPRIVTDTNTAYDPDCSYTFTMETDAGSYGEPEFEITAQDEKTTEVTCKVKWTANGDATRNGFFNTADLVLLNRYLLGVPDSSIYDLNAVDLCRDGRIDVFDLCMMRRELLKTHSEVPYIEPDHLTQYGSPFTVVAEELALRLGPGEQYDAVDSIPKGTELSEKGFLESVSEWLFTEYNGQSGWIRTVAEDGTPTVYYEAMVDKPVIYLYPERETDVHVSLELTGSDLSTTYPKYQDGWDVVASPDGTLLNKADGTHHRYLFWDSSNCRTRFDFSKGFCVAGSDTERFLKETLTVMGLTEDERNEFIVYWLPRMEHNAYNLIAFQGDTYTNTAKLAITPQPDSLCRVFMAYVPLEQPVEIDPQTFRTFERKGFTVLEWGGTEIHSR